MTGKSLLAALLFSFATLAKLTAQCDCITTGNCPVPIVDNGIFTAYIEVEVNGPNDLGQSPLQQVCMTISHTYIGDLSVSLISPSGLEYLIMSDAGNNFGECGTGNDNAEICITLGTNHPLTNNVEYACNSAPCSVGICCLNGNWTVPCGGVTSPLTGAMQAPNCDLNDFNVPGQPANGTWKLKILDVCAVDSGNLENFSLTFAGGQSCYVCEADGGVLDSISVVSCLGDDDLMFGLTPNYPNGPLFGADAAEYGYIYLVTQGGIVIAQQNSPDLTGFPAGNYQVYGLSYLILHAGQVPSIVGMNINVVIATLSSATAPFCADVSDNNVPVTILPVIPDTDISETICQGDNFTIDTFSFNSTGNYSVVLDSWHGCDSTINIALTVTQPDTVDVVRDVCTGGCVTIGGQSYCAPTPQYIHLTNWQGCDSVVHLSFIVHAPTATITPANPPAITCANDSVVLSAATSGPGTLIYAWSGPAGYAGSTQANITATIAGTYTVTVSDNAVTPACTSTASVTVANGVVQPNLTLSGAAPSICQGQTFNLGSLTVIDQNNTGGVITYHSGTPATAGNQLSNPVVSPSATTTYYVKSTTGNCSNTLPVTVTVNPVPTATFTATPLSCINNNVTVSYTGSAGAGATYNWDFGGGTVVSGTGAGPYQVDYATPGAKTITLTVTENGCTSTLVTQNIQVDDALNAPVINCSPATDSINFTWNADPAITSYSVTSNVPGVHASPTSTSYQVSGLTPGQSVTITVVATGATTCGTVSTTYSCTAQNCPPGLAVALGPDTTICRTAGSGPFNLQATVTGGTGNGTFTYSGPGITNTSLGTFDPSQANLGANTINVNYSENGCPANSSMVIQVFQTPTASITATSPVCQLGLGSTVTFASPSAGLNFNWNFGGGFGTPGFGPGPHTVTWGTTGTKTVSVTVTEGGGCQATASTTVSVEQALSPLAPTCSSTNDVVTISWPALGNNTAYNVVVNSGQVATQITATSYQVTGLVPGEEVDFTITAFSTNSCDDQVANITCKVPDCPPILLTIDPVDTICLDAMTDPVQLVTRLGSTVPVNQTEYFGNGVSLSGLFNPQQAGPGAHTITAIYTNGLCTNSIDIVIYVIEIPTGDFTAPTTVCQGSPAIVELVGTAQANLSYSWNFDGGIATPGTGAGPHSVIWDTPGQKFITLSMENQQGCMSPIYAKMVTVITPLGAPQPTCSNTTTTSIEFTWPSVPGASGYQFTTTTGQTATQTGPTTWLVSGLQPEEQVCATVTALSGNACPPTTAQLCCNADPCPSITVDVASLTDYCLGSSTPEQLQVTVTGSNGTGVGNWSGPGVLNGGTGTFNASAAGFGQHTITYTFVEESCTYSDSITVGIFQQPTSVFTADAGICLSESATVTYSGQFSPTATYTWNFDGGVAVPGTGVGPHQVTWPTAGQKNISLSVVDGSCASSVFAQQVQVDNQLAAPTIVCSATTDGVVFTWNTVPGATGYTASGIGGVQTSDTTFAFTGLDPSDQVNMTLIVNGNTSCPLPSVPANCAALPCPQLSLSIAPVSPICLVAGTPMVNLVSSVIGTGAASGTRTWSGTGIVNASQGIFDPSVAGVGMHEITCVYQQLNCTYEAKTVIEIVAQPTADAGPDRLITCWESDQQVQLGGPLTTSSNNVIHSWTAASGSFPGDATARYPTVSIAGLYTLTVTNTALGCSDTDDVLVMSTQSNPQPEVGIEPINCGQNGKDANMTVTQVTGGTEPYLYSLNGEPFVSDNVFAFLEAGEYDLTVMDAEGCTGNTKFTVEEAGTVDVDLTANIIGQPMVEYGESISLTALTSLPEGELDSIQWTNGIYLSCTDCLDPVATPLTQSTFVVTLFKGNCSATDSLNVFVDRGDGEVYVPTAFSPNGDGHNDKFMIYAGPTVNRIKSFLVFDRWGEVVYEYSDFDPSDPARGWDGILDGQPMNPAVYVWFAEVEFQDGSVEVMEGDVTLVR